MDSLSIALAREHLIIEAVEYNSDQALECLKAYEEELRIRVCENFNLGYAGVTEISEFTAPLGSFIIARLGKLEVGCVGLKGNGGKTAEVKRLWVRPQARGLGLALRLMHEIEEVARSLSIETLRLDTNSALYEAVRFYRSMGWLEIERFNDDAFPDIFFEKPVSQTPYQKKI